MPSKPKSPTGQSDDVRQADESGEPARAGKSHGQPIDSKGTPPKSNSKGDNKDWESGRQQANS